MVLDNRTKLGITLAVAVVAVIASVWLAVLLLVIAALFIAWGQVPQRTEEFIGKLPGGNYIFKVLTQIESLLWAPDVRRKDLVQEDLVQKDPAKEE